MRVSTEIARPLRRPTGGNFHVTGSLQRRWLRRSGASELMDGDAFTSAELTANFRDIQRVNRWFGGTSAILLELPGLIPAGANTLSLLDIATGTADIPLAIHHWCAVRDLAVDITATDIAPRMLALAATQNADAPRIQLQQADARCMPFASRSFDVVTCSLALHHFDPADAVLVLREMDRLCRTGFVVNDLRRSALGYGATWLASRLTTRNRLTRHDAPLSVRRAYTPAELRSLLEEADVRDATVRNVPWFRMVAVKRAALD